MEMPPHHVHICVRAGRGGGPNLWTRPQDVSREPGLAEAIAEAMPEAMPEALL